MKYLITIVILLNSLIAFSDNSVQEKFLLEQFNTAQKPEDKIKFSLDLFYFYKENLNEIDKAKLYLYETQSIINKSKVKPEYEAELLRAFGWKHFFEKDYINAFSYFDKSAKLSFEENIDSSYINSKIDLAELYTVIRNYYVAELTLNQCLAYYYKNQKLLDIGKIYSKKSQLSIFRREYTYSQYFSHRAIEQFSKLNENRLLINEYNNLGYTFQLQKKYDSSLHYYKIAQNLALKNNLEKDFPYITGNIAYIMFQLGLVEEAYEPMRFDYLNSLKQNDWGSATNSLIFMAKINVNRNKLDSAKIQLDQSWPMLKEIQSLPSFYDYFETRSELMIKLNQKDSAYAYIKLSLNYMDSFRIQGNRLNAKMALFNHKVDLEMAKNEIDLATKKLNKITKILLIPFSIIFILAGYSFYSVYKTKKKIQVLVERGISKDQKIEELEKELLIEKLKNEINRK